MAGGIKRMGVVAACLLAAGLATGCTKKITITQYPVFWTEDLKTLAVIPFRNTTGVANAGDAVAEQLARSLAGNGTYRVYSRYDLKTFLDERDMQLALGGDASESAKALGRSGKVQGIITGTVTAYAVTSRSEPKRDPVYAYDSKGNMYVSGYRNWTQTHNQATVVASVILLRPDGTTLYSPAQAVQGTAQSTSTQYGPPSMDPPACLAEATRQAINGLVEEFCVVQKTIAIDPRLALRTACDYYDGKYTCTDTFKTTDKKMLAVVALPASCDRNRFRLTVVRANERNDLADVPLVWDRSWQNKEIELDPSEIASKGGGAGEYWVKFYSGPEPVLVNKVYLK